MLDFSIPAGKNTPEVICSSSKQTMEIRGKSYPENSKNFYEEILLHFRKALLPEEFEIVLDFDYVSSSSVFSVLEMLKKIQAYAPDTKFKVTYYFDEADDDMREIGMNYQKLSGLPVEMFTRD